MPVERTIATTHSPGRFSFVGGSDQESCSADHRFRRLLEIAARIAKGLRDRLDQCWRRRIGDEMARELGGEMRGGCGMDGEIAQHRAALLDVILFVTLAQHGLRAGLVHARIERELAAMLRAAVRGHPRPPGQRIGEADHVILAVTALYAQRVQLQRLARQVFVEAPVAIDAGDELAPIEPRLSR